MWNRMLIFVVAATLWGAGACDDSSPSCADGESRCKGATAGVCVGGSWEEETCSGDVPLCIDSPDGAFCSACRPGAFLCTADSEVLACDPETHEPFLYGFCDAEAGETCSSVGGGGCLATCESVEGTSTNPRVRLLGGGRLQPHHRRHGGCDLRPHGGQPLRRPS